MKAVLMLPTVIVTAWLIVGDADSEKLLKDGVKSMQDITGVLKNVKDENSAEAAVPKLDEPVKRLLSTMEGSKKLRVEDPNVAKLVEKYAKLNKEAQETLEQEAGRLRRQLVLQQILQKSKAWVKYETDMPFGANNLARMDLKSLEAAVLNYHVRHGTYPQTIDQLLVRDPKDGTPALLTEKLTTDPWNNKYLYEPNTLHPQTGKPLIYTVGAPGIDNLRISNWEIDAIQLKKKQPPKRVKEFVVEARAEPRPALKYRLVPGLAELNEGNAALGYIEFIAGHRDFLFGKTESDERNKLSLKPLAELPPGLNKYGENVLTWVDKAARLSYANWQLVDRAKSPAPAVGGASIVTSMLTIARAVDLRCRGQIAARDYEAALESMKTLFAMSKHIGDNNPTLMSLMVGVAIELLATRCLEEMIQQPGSPNMFWALRSLPSPYLDFGKAMDGEREYVQRQYGDLRSLSKSLTQAELESILNNYVDEAEFPKILKKATDLAADPGFLAQAKKRLLIQASKAPDLDRISALQIVVVDAVLQHEEQFQDVLKYFAAPYWQAIPAYRSFKKQAKSQPLLFAASGSVVMFSMFEQYVLDEQKFSLLPMVEAIRMYAANHGGAVPPNLEALKWLPLPVDPKTGKLFHYEVRDGKAIVQSAHSFDQIQGPSSIRIEVSIKQ